MAYQPPNGTQTAKSLYLRGRSEEAFKLLSRAIESSPLEVQAYIQLADLLADAGRFAEAIDILSRAPAGIDACLKNARCAYFHASLGHWHIADDLAKQVVAPSSFLALARVAQGMVAIGRGMPGEPSKLFGQAAACAPACAEAYLQLGNLRRGQGRLHEALEAFEQGLLEPPGLSDLFLNYHEVALLTGEFQRASFFLSSIQACHSENRRLRYLLIDLLLRQERHSEAMAEIETAIVTFGIDDGILKAALAVRAKIGPMEARSPTKEHLNVSLCMIVKNEERDLPACLHSIKPFVDEMIVVDTGSNDRTATLASIFGCKVFETEWENDFSKARNLSISKAGGDWILIMDADEVLSASDAAKFKRMTVAAGIRPCAYSMQKRHYTWAGNMIGWQPNAGEYPAEERGAGWYSSRLVRLFPNDRRIHFSFPVHELVEPSLQELAIEVRECCVPIHHYGKLRESRTQEKTKIYKKLGRKKLKRTKRDPAAVREFAIQCAHSGEHGQAIKLWKEYLEKAPRSAEAFLNIGTACWNLGRYSEALNYAEKALRIDPTMKEAGFNRALALLMMGRAEETKSTLQRLLVKQPDYPAAQFLLCVACACVGAVHPVEDEMVNLRSKALGPYLGESFLDVAKRLFAAAQIEYARRALEIAVKFDCANDEMLSLLEECRAAA
jgi:tetratricopeptide (TPR) repeat protein